LGIFGEHYAVILKKEFLNGFINKRVE